MSKLREAAHAVIDRWDSPKWAHDSVHTGELIAALRDALAEPDEVLAEREACISEVRAYSGIHFFDAAQIVEAIRARGNT